MFPLINYPALFSANITTGDNNPERSTAVQLLLMLNGPHFLIFKVHCSHARCTYTATHSTCIQTAQHSVYSVLYMHNYIMQLLCNICYAVSSM